ncbi:cell division protein PerM [Nocardioides sp. SYSU DS0663]|uniref:cell division protein PerM n=1 Tax=Nocardioides sp. SYSU DS0663 TaxID=3416445 RepID=UPI003F4C59DF
MTSLLPPSTARDATAGTRTGPGADPAHRRPLVLVATFGGAAAAAGTLLVCLALGVVGWFLSDAGAHGTASDGLRVGATGWLLGHGSGVRVQGAVLTAVPLGITLVCAWAVWRLGLRVGDAVSGHGPDADRIADGERDWTVPVAAALLTAGYVVVAVLTSAVATAPDSGVGTGRVVVWAVLLCLVLGAPAVAVGSGRAAIWAGRLPVPLRLALPACRGILAGWLLVSGAALLGALLLDLGTAANVLSQLHTDAGAATLLVLLSLLVVPNAVVFAGSYLLGPGFTVGVGTVVSPSVVAIGPLPMFPLLAALPDDRQPSTWAAAVAVVPVVVAAVALARDHRARPAGGWGEAVARALVAGVLAGLAFGLLAALAGGAVGPGRMREVGPFELEVVVHAVSAFGVGGLVGAVATTWWQRRGSEAAQ